MSSVIGESIMKYSYKIVLIIQCPVIGISCVFFYGNPAVLVHIHFVNAAVD